jgi:hypothetical protein
MQGLITDRLRVARGVLDEGWAVYDLSSEEARNDARDALIRQAIDHSFPAHGMVLSTGDVTLLADEAEDARRSWMALLRLRVDGNGTGTGADAEPAERDGPGDAPDDLAAWGATVAAQQADDWMTLLDRLRRRTRHYRVVDEARAVDAGERKTVRRFVRRCASELRIATPILQWIRPVRDQGDLVSLGDIAGCAIRQNGEHPVVYVRCDINDVRDRLRVVAHEVAHHSGADEPTARAYEHLALKRHTR